MLEAFCRHIDRVNERVGRAVSFLFIALTIIVGMEVVLRYCFNSPTIWAWDVNLMLGAVIILLGGGYAHLQRGHVVVDIFVTRLSPRVRAILDLVTSSLFFLGAGTLFWLAAGEAKASVEVKETWLSPWEPPLYPLKLIFAIAVLLLLLQGVVKFIRDIRIAGGARSESTS